ncbi:glycosyltransferase family 4 protein [Polynucleobacter sphagniphilus]|uniref:glycosyltransferase family 4 protein n=1 Tax=Polynucleobacter sphagniphilus TaxID=1743169 RepID=UPI00247477A1|nr:glycosyltransferase [Polynucleobacter sphagniphilus]
MSAQGIRVALFSTEGPGNFDPSPIFLDANPELAAMNELAKVIGHDEATIASRNLYPPRVEDMSCAINLMHSYAWEESAFPSQWVRNFNKYLTGITCLSTHVMKVMRDNGVNLPMTVSGCGVDHWERVEESSTSILDLMSLKSFKFLHISSFFPRKGPDALLEAWAKAFTDLDDVCLVIKTFPNPHNRVHEQLALLRARYPSCAQILVIEEDLSDSDLKALYKRCQVIVAPSYAEGFCLPIAEAMLSGIPAITTGWSGQLDFCTTENSWLVDYSFEQADTHFKLKPSAWAAIDIDSLVDAMRSACKTSPQQRKKMALAGRKVLLNQFRWVNVAERLIVFYRKLKGPLDISIPKVGWISTANTKCGIAKYSEHLMRGFQNSPYMLAPHADNLLEADSKNCIRCWRIGDGDNLKDLADAIKKLGLDTLVIQWNYGFFHHDHLMLFIQQQKKAGRVVVVDMHATVDPPENVEKKLINFIPALNLVDRILLHSIDDMNRLKSYGLVENIALFPLGILDVPAPEQMQLAIPTIVTFGFCLPHKGLEQTVDAVAQLRDSGERVNLLMVNALYPIDYSAELAQSLQARVEAYGLVDQVKIESRFLQDHESLALIQSADLALFVYSPTSESASAAVRYGIASGKPVMVTDQSIFSEFGDAVWRVKNNDPALLVTALKEVLGHIRSNSQEHQKKLKAAEAWKDQHTFSWLSERLEGMLQGLNFDIRNKGA